MSSISPKWWSEDTVAVVTGGNKGIGYEIVRGLAEKELTVVLTARDSARGQAAVDALKATGLKNIWFHTLNVNSSESAKALANWLKETFGGFDILVNNAAIVSGPSPGKDGLAVTYENAKAIVDTNYFGVKKVTEALLPVLRASSAGARIVNVSSIAGLYERLKKESLLNTFRDEEHYSKELADSLATQYLEAVKEGRSQEEGWIPEGVPNVPMYSESKLFLNVYTIALAKSLAGSQPEDHKIFVSIFCPGTTRTEMYSRIEDGGFVRPEELRMKTAADGADTGIWLALLPKEELAEKNGKRYSEREEYLFGRKNPPF